jgi:hypothetical protein
MVSFTNTADHLLVQIPILVQKRQDSVYSLYYVKTVPHPTDTDTINGQKHDYTMLDIQHEYIALSRENYVPLTSEQLELCTKIGPTYICENAHLLRHRSEHTCASAIYYEEGPEIINRVCRPTIVHDLHPVPTVLDAGPQLLLSNLPKPWILICEPDNRPIPYPYKAYVTVQRSEFCRCALSAGTFYITQTIAACEDKEAYDGVFTVGYTFNKILFDTLQAVFEIEQEMYIEEWLDDVHSEEPQFRLNDFEFYPDFEIDNVLQQDEGPTENRLEKVLEQILQGDSKFYKNNQHIDRANTKIDYYLKNMMWWEWAYVATNLAVTLLVIAALAFYFLCKKRIAAALLTTLPILPSGIARAEAAPLRGRPTLMPIITIGPWSQPTLDPEVEKEAEALMISVTTVFAILIVIAIAWQVAK